jgi:uncharacterized protein (DUF983 family)
MPRPRSKPSLLNALRLRCPYCGKTPMRAPGSLIEFARGCGPCGYRYEREIGYFSGASWMMNYTFAALVAMAAGGYMVWKHSDASDLVIAGVPATIGAVAALAFIPWGRALWVWLDHHLHPLTEADNYHKDLESR